MERTGQLALGDRECPQWYAEVVGDLLGDDRSARPNEAPDPSQRNDRARRPRFGPAVSNDTQARRVGEHLPGGLRVRLVGVAPPPRGCQGGGVLAGRSLVGPELGLPAHRLEYSQDGRVRRGPGVIVGL